MGHVLQQLFGVDITDPCNFRLIVGSSGRYGLESLPLRFCCWAPRSRLVAGNLTAASRSRPCLRDRRNLPEAAWAARGLARNWRARGFSVAVSRARRDRAAGLWRRSWSVMGAP